jgi:hypothetical protein
MFLDQDLCVGGESLDDFANSVNYFRQKFEAALLVRSRKPKDRTKQRDGSGSLGIVREMVPIPLHGISQLINFLNQVAQKFLVDFRRIKFVLAWEAISLPPAVRDVPAPELFEQTSVFVAPPVARGFCTYHPVLVKRAAIRTP